jgi:hypothetical protein
MSTWKLNTCGNMSQEWNRYNLLSSLRSWISSYQKQVSEPRHSGKLLITPSNATRAIAFAGKALKKHGTNPLQ